MSNKPNPHLNLNNSELWGGLIGLALGGFVIWSSFKLKIGSINDPGSGYVLFAMSVIIAAVTEGGPTVASRWEGARWSKPAALIVCLIVYCFALEPLGFLVSTIPLMLLLLRAIDPVRWVLAIPLGVLAPLGMWWLLKHVLLIQLPVGLFEIG
jgi:putative tricarboxylic transport membrane protein